MALGTSCGNEVEESASFCTSCGQRMPAAAQPSVAVTVTRPVCSSCGAQGDPNSAFCTECGQQLATQSAPIAEAVPVSNATTPASLGAEIVTKTSAIASCTSCGTRLEPGTGFCTNCGQPAASTGSASISESAPVLEAASSSRGKTTGVSPAITQPKIAPIAPESAVVAPALA